MILAATLLAVLPATFGGPAEAPKIPVLLVGGANNHWWQWTDASLEEILQESGKFAVTLTTNAPATLADAAGLAQYKALVLNYNGPRWGEAAEMNFLQAVQNGAGVVVIHAANNAFEGWKEYEELVALCWREGTGHGSFHPFDVKITDRDHPITHDFPDMRAHPDELYHKLVPMHGTSYRVLATAFSAAETGGSGQDEPMILVKDYGKGRVFHTPLGHVWTDAEDQKVSHLDPQFRELIVRGTEWAATGQVTPSVTAANALTPKEREEGWELLFDGRTPAGWRGFKAEGFPEKGWAVEDGALHVQGGGGDIVTAKSYQDFELRFEWKVAPGANSGVMYRVSEEHQYPWETGPEYQVLDDERHADGKDPRTSAASLYALFPPEGKASRPPGEWNSARILVVGNRVEHWLNGAKVVACEFASARWKELVGASKFATMPGFGAEPAGRIALQDHGDEVWYRSLAIRDLSWRPDRSTKLFDGKSLAGWTCFLENGAPCTTVWSVTPEGVLVCKGQPAGYVRTEADFTNYVLRVEWSFDPKVPGNSGVLLRQIGPDKVWPRSVEAQLQSGSAGDFWNIDEFPMQVVKERTNGRNTVRTGTNEKPLGEWNEYLITVWKGDVVLRVNGQILNQAWDCLETPGKIALQSEGVPIHFRDVRLLPLH